MDRAGENGQGESAQGRESVIWDRRYAGTCSQGVPHSDLAESDLLQPHYYNHVSKETVRVLKAISAAATISATILPTVIVMRCL